MLLMLIRVLQTHIYDLLRAAKVLDVTCLQQQETRVSRLSAPVPEESAFLRKELVLNRSQSRRMGYWLLKTEPEEWSWQHQAENGGLSVWDGVRNAQAQNMMKRMNIGDLCFFYHTGKRKEVVGIVRVVRTHYPDPSDESGKCGAVDVQEVIAVESAVTLAQIKEDDQIEDLQMLRQPRLSVVPISEAVWDRVCELGGVAPPKVSSDSESRQASEGIENNGRAEPKSQQTPGTTQAVSLLSRRAEKSKKSIEGNQPNVKSRSAHRNEDRAISVESRNAPKRVNNKQPSGKPGASKLIMSPSKDNKTTETKDGSLRNEVGPINIPAVTEKHLQPKKRVSSKLSRASKRKTQTGGSGEVVE